MAKFTIGGEAVECALPNFLFMEAAWGYITAWQGAAVNPSAGISVVPAVLSVVTTCEGAAEGGEPPDVSTDEGREKFKARVKELKRKLKPAEIAGLTPSLNELMIEAGLAKRPGEDQPAEEAESPSTEISEA